MKFAHNDGVVVAFGFWRGKRGFIREFREKDSGIEYFVEFDGPKKGAWIPEYDLKCPSFLDNLGKMFGGN